MGGGTGKIWHLDWEQEERYKKWGIMPSGLSNICEQAASVILLQLGLGHQLRRKYKMVLQPPTSLVLHWGQPGPEQTYTHCYPNSCTSHQYPWAVDGAECSREALSICSHGRWLRMHGWCLVSHAIEIFFHLMDMSNMLPESSHSSFTTSMGLS